MRATNAPPPAAREIEDDIPDALVDSVERVGHGEFEICFPLTRLLDLERKGLDIAPRMLVVRLLLRDNSGADDAGFCLHYVPDFEGSSPHCYLFVTSDDPFPPLVPNPCGGFEAPAGPVYGNCRLTHLLRSTVWDILNQRRTAIFMTIQSTLLAVYSAVARVLSRPASWCLVCGRSADSCGFKLSLWRPTICRSPACTRELWNEQAYIDILGLPNLMADRLVIDFLLSVVWAAANEETHLDLLPGCPVLRSRVAATIDSLPPLRALVATVTRKQPAATRMPLLHDAVAAGDGLSPQHSRDRIDLLAWIFATFRGFLCTAPSQFRISDAVLLQGNAKGLDMPLCHQLLLANGTPEQERAFTTAVVGAAATISRVPPPRSRTSSSNHIIGIPAFHAARPAHLWRILTEGLRTATSPRPRPIGFEDGNESPPPPFSSRPPSYSPPPVDPSDAKPPTGLSSPQSRYATPFEFMEEGDSGFTSPPTDVPTKETTTTTTGSSSCHSVFKSTDCDAKAGHTVVGCPAHHGLDRPNTVASSSASSISSATGLGMVDLAADPANALAPFSPPTLYYAGHSC